MMKTHADGTRARMRRVASTGVAGITVQDASCGWPVITAGSAANPADPGDFFRLLASPSILPGTRVPIVLDIVDQGSYVHRDTVEVTVGTPLVVMSSNGSSMTGWTPTGTWGRGTTGPLPPCRCR